MTWRIFGPFLAAALLWGANGPAHASATYQFHKTSSNPADLPVAIEMIFDGPGASMAGDSFGGGFDGLLSFAFRLGSIDVELADLQQVQQRCAPPSPSPGCQPAALSYALTPEDGFLRFNNQSFDFAIAYGEAFLAGSFNTDGPGPAACRQSGACRYEGTWSAVPTPATAAMLALGLAGLMLSQVRRRRLVRITY